MPAGHRRDASGAHVRRPVICYVTDRKSIGPGDTNARLLERVSVAVRAGVDWVQIREKDLPGGALLLLAREALNVERGVRDAGRAGAKIFVNDRADVAIAAHAAGVHLGAESLPAGEVVRWCRGRNAPPGFQVGVSCHSIEHARLAERAGADYIFFGPVFDTPSKRGFGPPQGVERLREVCRVVQIPVIAIGGLNEKNADECVRAGASGIAAIRMFQERDSGELQEFISKFKGC